MRNRVRYPIDQSPFFRLGSKRKLASLLQVAPTLLKALAAGTQYNVFRNKRGRLIQHPIDELGITHRRIAKLLARIELPDYVHSQNGRSYVTNAKAHIGNIPVIKTDLTAYYPSVTFRHVFDLFRYDFDCPWDVAWLLARICTYRGEHVPTGSEISGIVAFLATRKMFDEMHALAIRHGCKLTCYVDDIVLSGSRATKQLLVKVRRVAARHGMATKNEKSKTFAADSAKTITGCIVKGEKVLLPNIRRHKIMMLDRRLHGLIDAVERIPLERSLRGRLQEARQIESVNA